MNLNPKSKQTDLIGDALSAMPALAASDIEVRNNILKRFANLLLRDREKLLEINAAEVARGVAAGLSESVCDRLCLAGGNFASMVDSIHSVVALPDPLGSGPEHKQPNGIWVSRMRVPLGLVCFIYESRPNVTADGAALCIKSGNGVILRGGKEALDSNLAIGRLAQQALTDENLPPSIVQVISDPDRNEISRLLTDERFDMVIPRGGKGLVEHVQKIATAPVLAHLYGNCHLYVHSSADLQQAAPIIVNAKTQRPGTCNALESLLVDEAVAAKLLARIAPLLFAAQVQIVGCPATCAILGDNCTQAQNSDWDEEYLTLKISIKIVAGLNDAVKWINQHGSKHTDGILSTDRDAIEHFIQFVDSSSVMVNTSTRFADGYMYGLGAETGVSTGKFHARGPVGLEGLTTYKWIVRSDGATRN